MNKVVKKLCKIGIALMLMLALVIGCIPTSVREVEAATSISGVSKIFI